jgi:uncharacterized protein (TIGR02598 family)
MKLSRAVAGFSLVEVVLAVGIAGFVLVSIIGLLSVSLKSARESSTDTLVVGMASRTLSELRAKSFSDLNPSLAALTNRIYFDDLGMQTSTQGTMGFACDVVLQGDANTLNPDTNLSASQRINLIRAKLIFSMLGQTATNRVVHSSLARY